MISISGVTIGTALLIIVLSVFNGFFEIIQGMLLANDPDIRIEHAEDRSFFMPEEDKQQILNHPEVLSLSPYIEGKALVSQREGRNRVVVVRGVEAERFAESSEREEILIEGGIDLDLADNRPGVLIGEQVSNSLGLRINDEFTLMSASGMQRALTQFAGPRTVNFQVRGIYSMQRMADESIIYINHQAAERLFDQLNRISGIDVNLTHHDRAEQTKQQLQAQLGDAYTVQSWYDLQRPLYDIMNLEKWGAYLILMIIVLVAVLNIIGSLTMMVIQKKRDIGLLMSYGFTKNQIRRVFLHQGLYIGLIGCGLGGTLGLLLCWLQDRFELVKLAGAEAFIISAYPVDVVWSDVTLVLGGSLLLCLLASWYPSHRASGIQPADAVRYE